MENVVELLDKYLEKLGMTAQQAYPYLVQYTFVHGLIWMAFSVVPIVLGILLLRIRKQTTKEDEKGFILFLAMMFFSGALLFILQNVPEVFAPEATTIHDLVQQLSGGK